MECDVSFQSTSSSVQHGTRGVDKQQLEHASPLSMKAMWQKEACSDLQRICDVGVHSVHCEEHILQLKADLEGTALCRRL